MAGYFELVDAPDGGYRIRMMDGAGKLMAVSVTFPTKKAAVAGIAQAREIAGTGLIRDRSADGRPAVPGSSARVIRGRRAGGRSHSAVVGPQAAGKRAQARH
ncbi:YegP family protein [Arthrobacter sp. 2MCAF15]|uniref:YegP family protein n=1 Tax=Arthrobacter sp. 2MCAF15 TaxID=3232984 RepID=UPI003F9328BA